jgi:NADPH:quinone reductase-like Zn-dependent oxidoreductase
VLVKIRAASVNAADWHLMRRFPHLIARLLRMPVTRVRGGDMAGQVEAVGRSVTLWKPGDEVFGAAIGTFAEYAATFEDRLAPRPRILTFEQAAAVPGAEAGKLSPVIDREYPLAGVPAALRYVGAGQARGKVVIRVA